MRRRQCDDCNYAAFKGEPVFNDCPQCLKATCDKCGMELSLSYFSTNGKDYHFDCVVVQKEP